MYFTEKAVSSFPIAIGTAIALETLFKPRIAVYDPDKVRPDKVNINKYEFCYINIATLYRNLLASVDGNVLLVSKPDEIAKELFDEISIIQSLFFNEGNNVCQPIFYVIDYLNIAKTYVKKKVTFRTSTTDKQKIYDDKYIKMLSFLMEQVDIKVYKDLIVPIDRNRSLIVTHMAYDLLSYKNFNILDLLESHTGKLKTKYQFSSKYQPSGSFDVSNLPFSRKLLFTLGDKTFIKPAPIALRKNLFEIANKKHWTSHTTDDKITFDINSHIKEPYVLQWFNNL